MDLVAILESLGPVAGKDFAAIRGTADDFSIDWIGEALVSDADFAAAIAAFVPMQPDWDGFNAYILANTQFKATTATVRATHPELVEALPSAYLLVGQGNPATFAFLMGQIYTVASVSQSQRNTWADTARDVYNLPADFVAVVRGS
jgi:hypothetical protein